MDRWLCECGKIYTSKNMKKKEVNDCFNSTTPVCPYCGLDQMSGSEVKYLGGE